MYSPSPVDTSKVDLPEGLQDLVEDLAKNAHETWAKLRIEEGWSFGTFRDDSKKTHPDLVPYDELSESEKEYDRKMAIETVKVIILSGYKINKN